MTNLEFKKDSTWGPISNLALDSIVKVVIYPRTEGFRPMVSSAVWGKAPAARYEGVLVVEVRFFTDDPIANVTSANNVEYEAFHT